MIADPLTKLNADPSFLRFVMKVGEFRVVQEHKSLEWRSREREARKGARALERAQGMKKGCVNRMQPSPEPIAAREYRAIPVTSTIECTEVKARTLYPQRGA